MKGTILLLALLCAASSQAQTLQKCSGKGGTTAYRSGNCLPGERLVEARDNPPDVHALPSVPEQPSHGSDLGNAKRPSRNGGNHSHASRGVRTTRSRHVTPPRENPCATTKQARDDYQKRRGIKITMVELSRWNNRVYDACK